MQKIHILLITLLIAFAGYAQREKDGDYTAVALNEIVNTYTSLSGNVNAAANSISVVNNSMTGAGFSGPLQAGDLLLIYQIQAGKANLNNYPTIEGWGDYVVQDSWFDPGVNNGVNSYIEFGEVQDYRNVGIYEYVEVLSVSGTQTITLTCPLENKFDSGTNNKTQVIRVPRYKNLSIPNNMSITTPIWNGTIGGVVAIEVSGTLNITGTGKISADSTGFRGGLPVNHGSAAGSAGTIANINDRGYLGSQSIMEGSEKGEGITGGSIEYDDYDSRYGYGSISNGGGGGGYHNAGGGGGSNVGVGNYYGYGVVDQGPANAYNSAWNIEDPNMVTTPSAGGGRGGYSHGQNNHNPLTVGPHNTLWGSDYRRISGGVGGHPLTYTANRVFLGGGGGAGHGNDNYAGIGGAGGGAVFLNLYGDVIGDGLISANGGNGENAEGASNPGFGSKTGDDGAGGAGGGGAVVIKNINAIPTTINLEAKGGNGGDQTILFGLLTNPNQADGPGGGGAGGLISFSLGTPVEDVSGGSAGETNSGIMALFPVNGATSGASGMASQSTTAFDILVENDTLCGSGTVNITPTVLGNFTPTPTLSWYDAPIGGNYLFTGATFATPVLTSTTTYYVGTCPGTFRVPVTIVVSPPILFGGTVIISPQTCAGNDGSITGITTSGGIGPLTFDWNGNSTPSEDLINVIGGTYTLTVTDLAGCSETVGPVTISAASGPVVDVSNITITDESCNGNDGSITGITVSGGAIPYTYAWNGNSSASADLTGQTGGSYTLVVTDNNLCVSTVGPFTINSAAAISIDIINMSITDESCNGLDGSITGITASGGTGTLSYSWNPSSSTTLDLNTVANGSYTLTVTDGSGCSATSGPHVINQTGGPAFDDANAVITDETCGSGNGSITGITTTGTGLTYAWSPSGATTLGASNLSNGTHTLIITDGSGCTSTAGPYTVINNAGPVIDISNSTITPETCFGNDGGITGITFTGGQAPFTFDWNGTTSTSQDLLNVAGGTYTLTITDGNGCTSSSSVITIPPTPGAVIDLTGMLISDETCNTINGSILGITISGGATPYTYSWNGSPATGADLTNIAAGSYTLEVTDNNGCATTVGPFVVNGDPALLIDATNIVITDESCNVSNGSIVGITATGGTGTLTYSWNPSSATTLDLNAVLNGSYTLTVTDASGCSETSGPHTINQIGSPTFNDANINITDEFCGSGNGSITGITTTGTGLTYAWAPSGSTTLDAANLSNGTHTLLITDAAGCIVSAGPYTVNNIAGPSLDISGVNIFPENCFGNNGRITGITVSGGTPPYTMNWGTTVTSTPDLTNVVGGTYSLIVIDANGCSANSGTFTIPSFEIPVVSILTPDQLISAGDSVHIQTTVTPPTSNLFWSPVDGLSCVTCPDPIASPSVSTWYVVTAISPDGCSTKESIYIEVRIPCGKVKVPTNFTPNGDGLNDELCVLGNCIQSMSFQVFNRWGELVFETNEISSCWDGTFKGKLAPTGVYVYRMKGIDHDGKIVESSGNVNLLR